MSNCPIGTENDRNAPWNEKENIDRKVDITVSITLSRTLTILVNDYTVDEEGNIDFSNCDLRKAVEQQSILPLQALHEWNIDDYEIMLE